MYVYIICISLNFHSITIIILRSDICVHVCDSVCTHTDVCVCVVV